MDAGGSGWQPRGHGRGRGRGRWSPRPNAPFNHLHSPTQTPPPPAVVEDQLSVSASASASATTSNSWPMPIRDRRITSEHKSAVTFSHNPVPASASLYNNNNSPDPDVVVDVSSSPSSSSDCGMPLSHSHDDHSHSHSHSQDKTSTTPTHQTTLDPFDICPPKQSATVVLKTPLLFKNREKRNEIKRTHTPKGLVLRPGMVLLKAYISLTDQVKIVKRCRELGVGSGGFYQPGYREGTKLHLKMMCLGKNWDPQTSQYGDHRPFDGANPPDIPLEFHDLIHKAIRDSHAFIQQHSKTTNPHDILPSMSSDICIVNFYSQNGRLGLHQDKDESEESLHQGLPVVSFSIGDSADFLYGDERDVDKAQKVVLESGDVLIFGGRSRNVFHGVTTIHPMTAPKLLLEETNLRPGRLNLTFRQY